jgi:hypothetical protein
MTGPDNRTIAIGRLLGSVVAALLLMAMPIVAVITVLCGISTVETWRQLLGALGLYVPLIVGAITGLIWGTNPTEPKPAGEEGPTNG